jgi:hypothetical protein
MYARVRARRTFSILSAAAMAKVMAGTEFWMAEANVGDVLSRPSR